MCEQAVVRTPLVANKSLMPRGMPSSGRATPLAMRASLSLAASSARSGVVSTKALSASLARPIASMRARELFGGQLLAEKRLARFGNGKIGGVGHALGLNGVALDKGTVGFARSLLVECLALPAGRLTGLSWSRAPARLLRGIRLAAVGLCRRIV